MIKFAVCIASSNNKHFSSTTTTTTTATTTFKTSTMKRKILGTSSRILIVMNLWLAASWRPASEHSNSGYKLSTWVEAVSVQRLSVPDLVVIDQLNQQQQQSNRNSPDHYKAQNINLNSNSQPEAASLINSQDLNSEQQSQVIFECLISFDKRRDKNLVVKWHHDDRTEPIYQWIPALDKRSIATQYRAFIVPIVQQHPQPLDPTNVTHTHGSLSAQQATTTNLSNQTQLLEAGFKLIRPSKELGGKYTCSAISTQNDDSKWKKMIVFTPPRIFRFNASRTDIGALLASQRERLIQPSMIGPVNPHSILSTHQLPLAYRMKGFENLQQQQQIPTTISPSMYSTIDYVNVNQQRARQTSPTLPWLVGSPTSTLQASSLPRFDPLSRSQSSSPMKQNRMQQQNGVKLVCDIDQVFPVPEVSIYRLAKLDGSYPDKLAKLDTKIERNPITGLFHVQVTSILEDEELQMKYGLNEPVYFECLIALTNLELSKYADNKRSIIYRPGLLTSSPLGVQPSEDIISEPIGSSATKVNLNQNNISMVIILILLTHLCSFHNLRRDR